MRIEQLPDRVKAVNAANAEAKRLEPLLKAAIKPFLNHKIYKADGDLMAKVEAALNPHLPNSRDLRSWRYRSDYFLVYVIRADVYGSEWSVSHEMSLYIADVKGGHAVALYPSPLEARSDYTVAEVTKLLAAAEDAKDRLQCAVSALGEFGVMFHR